MSENTGLTKSKKIKLNLYVYAIIIWLMIKIDEITNEIEKGVDM